MRLSRPVITEDVVCYCSVFGDDVDDLCEVPMIVIDNKTAAAAFGLEQSSKLLFRSGTS